MFFDEFPKKEFVVNTPINLFPYPTHPSPLKVVFEPLDVISTAQTTAPFFAFLQRPLTAENFIHPSFATIDLFHSDTPSILTLTSKLPDDYIFFTTALMLEYKPILDQLVINFLNETLTPLDNSPLSYDEIMEKYLPFFQSSFSPPESTIHESFWFDPVNRLPHDHFKDSLERLHKLNLIELNSPEWPEEVFLSEQFLNNKEIFLVRNSFN